MDINSINKDLAKAFSHFPPEMRAKLNTLNNKLMKITYKEGMTPEEHEMMTRRAHEDFNLSMKDGSKDNK